MQHDVSASQAVGNAGFTAPCWPLAALLATKVTVAKASSRKLSRIDAHAATDGCTRTVCQPAAAHEQDKVITLSVPTASTALWPVPWLVWCAILPATGATTFSFRKCMLDAKGSAQAACCCGS